MTQTENTVTEHQDVGADAAASLEPDPEAEAAQPGVAGGEDDPQAEADAEDQAGQSSEPSVNEPGSEPGSEPGASK